VKRILQRPATYIIAIPIIVILLLVVVQGRPQSASFSYFYPRVEFGEGWKTSLSLVNMGQNASNVRLLAYNAGGTLIKDIGISPAIMPGERRDYPTENGAWPDGIASLKVESEGAIYSYLMLENSDGSALEAIMPVADRATTLTFPLVTGGAQSWSQLSLLNVGSEQAMLQAVALDANGQILATAVLSPLSPMASSTVSVADLFDSATIGSIAAVQVVANKPLAGLQLFGSGNDSDIAALPAPLTEGQELFLPVFQEGDGVPLWTVIGLINPRDGPVSIKIEAFDAQHRSLALFSDPTILSAHGSYFFYTANIAGALPSETDSVTIISDQPISGYAVVGALRAQGLTAVNALTENDPASGYELIGSDDGVVLAAVPLVVMPDRTSGPAFTKAESGFWQRGVSLSKKNLQSSYLIGRSQLSVTRSSISAPEVISVAASAGTFQWPLFPFTSVPTITQDYACRGTTPSGFDSCFKSDQYHTGIDMTSTSSDQNIYASEAGTVVSAVNNCDPGVFCNGGFGNTVIIQHATGLYSQYGHMQKGSIAVTGGQGVAKGQKIGFMGNTGNVGYGIHLHFEIKNNSNLGAGYTTAPPDVNGYFDP